MLFLRSPAAVAVPSVALVLRSSLSWSRATLALRDISILLLFCSILNLLKLSRTLILRSLCCTLASLLARRFVSVENLREAAFCLSILCSKRFSNRFAAARASALHRDTRKPCRVTAGAGPNSGGVISLCSTIVLKSLPASLAVIPKPAMKSRKRTAGTVGSSVCSPLATAHAPKAVSRFMNFLRSRRRRDIRFLQGLVFRIASTNSLRERLACFSPKRKL
mmetsp:Transcript_88186/g.166193  ORF Transcript_88186/g.166193 Transcript_88186/m.166193 type:complete len:221 (-) Transcript_88186:492-1154(-)